MTTYLQQKTLYPPLIERSASKNLGLVVVIPAYNEPYLLRSLTALYQCQLGQWDVEVIVIINDSEADKASIKATNQSVYEQTKKWAQRHSTPRFQFEILYKRDLPDEFAGVGTARKIGMDEACYRFEKVKRKHGVIACFDADSSCLPNYFLALEEYFQRYSHLAACSIHFEHLLDGTEYEPTIYAAAATYELYLRYYINAQRWAGVPYAFQVLGSAIAVRADYYQQQGGMNRRKTGEDFYFLHKFIALGKCANLTNTTVFPASRISDRVPYGTGKSIQKILNKNNVYKIYHPNCFKDLKNFFKELPQLYTTPVSWQQLPLSDCVRQFLMHQDFDFDARLKEIRNSTANKEAFVKCFYQWFDIFQFIKFTDFAKANFYKRSEERRVGKECLALMGQGSKKMDIRELLSQFRTIDHNLFKE